MRIVFFLLLFILSGCHKPDSSLKLYVFDCGTLKSGNPSPFTEHGVTTTDMSVAAYLIVHPSGTLLWDTGVIPDQMITERNGFSLGPVVHLRPGRRAARLSGATYNYLPLDL